VTAPAIVWTQEPLPVDVRVAAALVCRTCNAEEVSCDWRQAPYTRSTEPPSGSNYYLVQPHEAWCPVWTGLVPDPACPDCGAPVYDVDISPGYSLSVPDPVLGTAHIVGTADEVFAHPAARRAGAVDAAKRVKSLDKVTVSPCGHTLRGDDFRRVLVRFVDLRRHRVRAEDDAVIAAAGPLLAAAEQAGQTALADAYRTAVRARSRDASGLLAALRILHPQAETAGPVT